MPLITDQLFTQTLDLVLDTLHTDDPKEAFKDGFAKGVLFAQGYIDERVSELEAQLAKMRVSHIALTIMLTGGSMEEPHHGPR